MGSHTRERIMEVALHLFAAKGVAATPITAIEAAAGLSPGSGSFYRHFKDKAELLSSVVDREIIRVKRNPAAQVTRAPAGMAPADALAVQLLADLDFLKDLLPLIAILMWERDQAPNLARRVEETMVERGIELGITDLMFKAPARAVLENPIGAATVMMSAMVGYFLSVEYFGRPPAGIGAEQFSTVLARLLVDADGSLPGD